MPGYLTLPQDNTGDNNMNRSWKTCSFVALIGLLLLAGSGRAADEPSEKIATAIRTIQRWEDGNPAGDLNLLAAEVVSAAGDAKKRKAMEQWMIQGLAGATTRAGRDFFCRQLVVVGTEAAVPELAKWLTDSESSHMARYALARIPGEAADAALLDALAKVDDKLKIGMVHSLGRRNCRDAVDKIRPLLESANQDLVVASLVALSHIDSDAAVAAIANARETVPQEIQVVATDAYLDCAARLVRQGAAEQAVTIYRKLFAPEEPSMCRVAALTGMVNAQKDQSISVVIAALGDQAPEIRRVAVPALREVPGEGATKAIVAELAKQDETVQAMLLAVLADRGDRAAMPAAVNAADGPSLAVRVAALEALSDLGDASVVPMLAQRAASVQESAERQAARGSLDALRGDATNSEIAKQLGADDPGVRAEAARSLAARGAADQAGVLLRAAQDPEAAVATEAMKALQTLARADHVPALVKLLVDAKDNGVRGEAENAIVAAAGTAPDNQNPAQPVLAALPAVEVPEVRVSLIRVLGRIAHASALPALYDAAKDAPAETKDAAVRALAAWPTGAPAQVLWGVAADTSAPLTHRVLALRGYVDMIPKQTDATDDQILDDYGRALELAERSEEKLLILSKLAHVRHRRALKMARSLAADEALKTSAEAAVQSIERLLAAPARVTASKKPEAADRAIDGDPRTRWDTGSPMQGGEWFRIELDEDRLITGLVLDTRGSSGDYARGYEVYVSPSSLGEGRLVIKGEGKEPLTRIVFDKPVLGRAIKIVQTGKTQGLYWSIHELTIESHSPKKE